MRSTVHPQIHHWGPEVYADPSKYQYKTETLITIVLCVSQMSNSEEAHGYMTVPGKAVGRSPRIDTMDFSMDFTFSLY